jgi:hypothetical protein
MPIRTAACSIVLKPVPLCCATPQGTQPNPHALTFQQHWRNRSQRQLVCNSLQVLYTLNQVHFQSPTCHPRFTRRECCSSTMQSNLKSRRSPFAGSPDFLLPPMSKVMQSLAHVTLFVSCSSPQVPLDGFGSFPSSRSRRPAAGAVGGLGRNRHHHDTSTGRGDPLLLLQEGGRRSGSNSSPEDKLLSPPFSSTPPASAPAPAPPPPFPPKRRGRPPGSTKSGPAATAAFPAASSKPSQQIAAAAAVPPPTKRPRSSEKEEGKAVPITAPPPTLTKATAAAGGRVKEKIVFFGDMYMEERWAFVF